MTDVGNVQAGTVAAAPGAARPRVQVVPLRGLLVIFALDVPVVIAFTVARYSSPPHSEGLAGG